MENVPVVRTYVVMAQVQIVHTYLFGHIRGSWPILSPSEWRKKVAEETTKVLKILTVVVPLKPVCSTLVLLLRLKNLMICCP